MIEIILYLATGVIASLMIATTVLLLGSIVYGLRREGIHCGGVCHYYPECSYHFLLRSQTIILKIVSNAKALFKPKRQHTYK